VYVYHQNYSQDHLQLAKPVTQVTSALVPDTASKSGEVSAVPSFWSVTEERSIHLVLFFAIVLCLMVFFVMKKEKNKLGAKGIQDALMAVSILLVMTIATTSLRMGLINA